VKEVLEYSSLAVVELPDRYVMDPWTLIVVDASGATIDVLSFDDIAAAVNFCGQQLAGTVLSIDLLAQEVTCEADAGAGN
jgi:hypothetical protein